MDKCIVEYLKDKKDRTSDLYTWGFKESIPQKQFNITVSGNTCFEKTVSLKDQLRAHLKKNPASEQDVAEYFIKEWGGIKRFSKSNEVVSEFSQWKGTAERPLIFKPKFPSISSWSKWAALVCPEWACIYDARVAYSINAINYLKGGEHKIFPSPEGRNSRLELLDVTTLLLSIKLQQGESNPKHVKEVHFVKEKDAYLKYLDLVGSVSEALWNDRSHIHQVEMLLFSLADKDIYRDLFDKVCQTSGHL